MGKDNTKAKTTVANSENPVPKIQLIVPYTKPNADKSGGVKVKLGNKDNNPCKIEIKNIKKVYIIIILLFYDLKFVK
jgi:hypothetical protein